MGQLLDSVNYIEPENYRGNKIEKKVEYLSGYNSKKIATLVNQIIDHKAKYYAGTPEISDVKYDAIEEELRKVCPNHPVLSMVGNGQNISSNKKVVHKKPMLSLSKTYSMDELVSWKKDHDVVGTLKLDGNSLSLMYENGQLKLAKTRGNGQQGENVTDKILWVADCIPFTDDSRVKNFEVRGELFCTESRFIELSEEMISKGLEPPTNPRNIVAGILGRKQFLSLARYFNFNAFDVILEEDQEQIFSSEMEKFKWLESIGFKLPDYALIRTEIELEKFLGQAKLFMEEDEIGIDGAVFTYNDSSLHKKLGETAHHPRYKMSFKWQGSTATTKIVGFIWATSRLGIVTPVAIIEPTVLSGATITNVTLHNAAHVKLFELKVGDEIEIVRSGEVIPKFLSIVNKSEGQCIIPEKCPSCHESLEFDGVRLICKNSVICPAQQVGTILNWIKAASIDDMSEKRLQSMVDLGFVKHMSDLYLLTMEDMLKLPLTKEKMAKKLYENIQASKNLTLVQFLNGIGIQGAGVTTWENLLQHYPTLDQVRKLQIEQIVVIDGFAEKSSQQIVDGLSQKSDDIEKLISVGVNPVAYQPRVANTDSKISGKTIVITGTLSHPRNEFEQAILEAGGKLGSTISKNTDALIIADPNSNSSKAKKARELGVTLWSEEDFWSQLK